METQIREYLVFDFKEILRGMVLLIRTGRKTLKLKIIKLKGKTKSVCSKKQHSDEMTFK